MKASINDKYSVPDEQKLSRKKGSWTTIKKDDKGWLIKMQ